MRILRVIMQLISTIFKILKIFITVLHKHAPIKEKIVRFNNIPFMSIALKKQLCIDQNKKT